MFISEDKVRMHDTDMAGIIYFTRQFRFSHDALEDFLTSYGFDFDTVFNKLQFVFVIVHAEADYYAPLKVGDPITTKLFISHLGKSSFTIENHLYRKKELVGKTKTVHVTLNSQTRKKILIPENFLDVLRAHLEPPIK